MISNSQNQFGVTYAFLKLHTRKAEISAVKFAITAAKFWAKRKKQLTVRAAVPAATAGVLRQKKPMYI